MKRILIALSVLVLLGLACSTTATVAPTALPLPTYTLQPTYTPYPTIPQPTAIPYVAPTAEPQQGQAGANICAMRISGGSFVFYAVVTGPGVSSLCPKLVQQMRAADKDSLLTIAIVSTFPTEPIICQKNYGSGIAISVVDTSDDTRLSESFCGGLG